MPRQTTSEEFQELGRGYYKLKQYQKAIEAFTQGIDITPTPSLYDYRAASYDKLEDYNAAVKDGREVIKLDKKNEIKGYLRTASILEKMEKLEVALGIYKYGMKNVPVGDKNFKVRAVSQLCIRYLTDVCTAPPAAPRQDHAQTVSRKVRRPPYRPPHRARGNDTEIPVLPNCMRVSKGWRDYVAKLPRLWLHLDLSGARKPVARSFVNKAVRRSESRLTHVTVHRFEHLDMLKNIANVCKNLAELDFISIPHAMSATLIEIVRVASRLKKIVVHPEITLDTATQILRYGSDLEHVSFRSVTPSSRRADWQGPFNALTTFYISLPSQVLPGENLNLLGLFGQSPAIQSLTLSNMGFRNAILQTDSSFAQLPLTTLILKRFGNYLRFPHCPSTLEKLVFECGDTLNMTHSKTILLQSRLPVLTHLSLSFVLNMCADKMENLLDTYIDSNDEGQIKRLENTAPLQHIKFQHVLLDQSCTGLFKDTNSLFGRSPRVLTPALRVLDIANMPCNDDEVEYLLGYEITGLTSINLSYSQITGASIKMLADKLPSLQAIQADNCSKINGRDAIEYAQRKGITVSCSMNEGRGKRVRYG
jgi:F-box/TPR repeat protein Pof3